MKQQDEQNTAVLKARTHVEESRKAFAGAFKNIVERALRNSRSQNVQARNIREVVKGSVPVAIGFAKRCIAKQIYLESYKSALVEKNNSDCILTLEQKIYQPFEDSELKELARVLKGIHVGKRCSLFKVLKQDGKAAELGEVKQQIIQLGRRLSGILMQLQIVMTSENDVVMEPKFRSFKSVFAILEEISFCDCTILKKVNHQLAHGEDVLIKLLAEKKLRNLYVTTDWSTLGERQMDSFLDRVVGIIMKVDLLLSLPLLPSLPSTSAINSIMGVLEYITEPIEVMTRFLREEVIGKVFKANYELKVAPTISRELADRMRPFLEGLWNESIFGGEI
ncbi:hypothetical protein RchiOBHm_Chr3g0450201 [Rosa chinensis]|uniref:Uncharacterized protein n=1 Tax=Rosa chinensis TaxID=74649 RepID=A0A2P6R5Q2_ROSCH|nr:hypothetical protein RchiOBHm_Chr3g0450201 [Rosa chinensis]